MKRMRSKALIAVFLLALAVRGGARADEPAKPPVVDDVHLFDLPSTGFRLSEEGVRAGARLVRRVHDLTEGTAFADGSEVACHPNLSQPNFIFREMIPVAIIDWDGTYPGSRLSNFGEFLWAFVHPAVYGEGEHAAQMLRVAADAYGWPLELFDR